MQNLFGIIGSLFFAIASWPQAFLSLKTKSAKGINWSFILLWLSGSFFSSIYAIGTDKYVLLPNYILGGLGMLVVCFVKIQETLKNRKKDNGIY
ncbi:MAG: PQ-loop repeat-containing protein [Alphaproteobacteria bacterium]|nr:PQ-loop repeat-containing protein [Alphaproteobacteria bacterium]